MKIILETLIKVFKREDISEEGMETAEDFGDYLLHHNKVNSETYDRLQEEAKELVRNF